MSTKGKAKSNKKRTQVQSDSASDSEHELFYYCNNRVQLMKEVLKILKLKKIKTLAPPSIKKMDMDEINTLLLEELLGISNKRLKKILEGQNADDASSSSDEDKVDVISLDSISDDEICFVDETKDETSYKKAKAKNCHRKHKIKKEKDPGPKIKIENIESEKEKRREKLSKTSSGLENEKLLSVLELLELQARARAIRSQLALEAENKAKETADTQLHSAIAHDLEGSDDDAVIIETPVVNEIVISSSDSETEKAKQPQNDNLAEQNNRQVTETQSQETSVTDREEKQMNVLEPTATAQKAVTQKIKLIRSILLDPQTSTSTTSKNFVQEVIETEPSTNIDLNEIPLPQMVNPPDETQDNKQDAKIDKAPDCTQCKVTLESEASIVSTLKKNESKVIPPTEEHDDERDVIRLDIVEIDGMDD